MESTIIWRFEFLLECFSNNLPTRDIFLQVWLEHVFMASLRILDSALVPILYPLLVLSTGVWCPNPICKTTPWSCFHQPVWYAFHGLISSFGISIFGFHFWDCLSKDGSDLQQSYDCSAGAVVKSQMPPQSTIVALTYPKMARPL